MINTKELRSSLPEIIKRVRRGQRFLVLYRSRPAFRLVPVDACHMIEETSLEDEALYHAGAVGRSDDGLTSADHDEILYGKVDR